MSYISDSSHPPLKRGEFFNSVKAYYGCEICAAGHPNKEAAEACERDCLHDKEMQTMRKEKHTIVDILVHCYAVIRCSNCGYLFQRELRHLRGVPKPPQDCYHGVDADTLCCGNCGEDAFLDEDETRKFFAEWELDR